MLASERKLQKPSPVPFLSKLAQACLKVSIRKAKYVSLKYGTNKTTTISRYSARLLHPVSLPSTLEQEQQLLSTARKEVRTIRRNAISERENFLLQWINDNTTPQHLTKIIARIR